VVLKEVLGLVDDSFAHHPECSVLGQTPTLMKWDRQTPFSHRFTVFTNENILSQRRFEVELSKRVAWLQESRGVLGHLYKNVSKVINDYSLFLTHDSRLLRDFTNTRFIPGGGIYIGTWFGGGSTTVKKQFLCSLVNSYKDTTLIHKFRNLVSDEFRKLDPELFHFFGGSQNFFDYIPIAPTLEPYYFSVIIENTLDDDYFTEKILNCFASKTIPIYLGASKIEKYFNAQGILRIRSFSHLFNKVLPNLSAEFYEDLKSAINENLELAQEYSNTEDYVYRNYLKS